MKSALETDDKPFDAHLQSVLPGVHHRFEVQSKQLSDLEQLVSRTTDFLANLIKDETNGICKTTVQRIGRSIVQAGNSLLNEKEVEFNEENDPPSLPATNPSQHRTINVDFGAIFLPAKFSSLPQLYAMWYGTGPYLERPYPGGLLALETTYKTKWRAHFSNAQKKTIHVSSSSDESTCRTS